MIRATKVTALLLCAAAAGESLYKVGRFRGYRLGFNRCQAEAVWLFEHGSFGGFAWRDPVAGKVY